MTLRVASVELLPEQCRAQARLQLVSANSGPARKQRKPRGDEEHNEQVVFFNRIRNLALNDARYAIAADRTYAIPNGGGRSKREAGRLKAEGVRPGVSDIFVSFPVPGSAGMYLEMKSLTGYPSREQRAWIPDSLALGYEAACCRGADEAYQTWLAYVGRGLEQGRGR
jgi:hypothetical protein